ncbi:MAG: 2-phosphosulfolactate phosphatase [Rhodospirillales bacterium]
MQIQRLSLAEGAREATGVAVIIDVFRAFTCEPLMLHLGARRLILEGDPQRCLATRGDAILVGEHNELPLPGFDLTNSPSMILAAGRALFSGRDVIHRTTSGVTGALAALERCEHVFLGAYVTARATAAAVRALAPAQVSLVAMGIRSMAPAPEDERCGDCLEHLLGGRPYDHVAACAEILQHETARKFLRGDQPHLPAADPALCLQRDLFDFALKAERDDDRVVVRPIA